MAYQLLSTINIPITFNTVFFNSSDNGDYIILYNGNTSYITSTNYGNTWSNTTTITSFNQGRNFAMSYDASYLYFSNTSTVFKSTDFGITWSSVTVFNSVSAPNNYCIFIACSSTGQYVSCGNCVSSDYGVTWILCTPPQISNFTDAVSMSSDGKYICYGGASNLIISTDYGITYKSFTNLPKLSATLSITGVTISDDGLFITVTPNSNGDYIFTSSNGGLTWKTTGFNTNGQYTPIRGNRKGNISCFTYLNNSTYYYYTFYYSQNQLSSYNILDSTLSNNTRGGSTGSNVFVNSSGNLIMIYILNYDDSSRKLKVYKFPNSNPTITINGSSVLVNGTYTAIARTSSVNVAVTPTDLRYVKSITGTTNLKDDLNVITITMSDGTINVYVMVLRNCFLEGTKILCYIDNEEKYIPVEQMKEGTLVKTFLNGYIPVHTIGHSKIYNPANKLRGENRLYKRTKKHYPEITEDLIITGCHSVLVDVDRITPEVRQKTMDLFKHETMATDTKYRLLTCLDELADPYEVEGTFPIWHFALDHYDIYMNYGVYANGLLVETCSINMMREHSGLDLV